MVTYTEHDKLLRDAAILRINFFDPDNVGAGPGVGHSAGPISVRFQFPPRILSDNRKSSWTEGDLPGSEPVAVFKVSGAREMSLSWTYIVDGDEFTTEVIAAQIKLVRGYFAGVRDEKMDTRNLVVNFRYILYGEQEEISARIKSVNVKHGDTIVYPPGVNGGTDMAFPLRTDIIIDLRLWTKGGPGNEKVQEIIGLAPYLSPKWY